MKALQCNNLAPRHSSPEVGVSEVCAVDNGQLTEVDIAEEADRRASAGVVGTLA